MSPIRALIVDDEPLARENLRLRLADHTDITVAGECAGGLAAVEAITADPPDLLFLDISMPDLDGFGVLDRLPDDLQPVVIFVTAYQDHALEAFRVHALDYLLKPFSDQRFDEALARARQHLVATEPPTAWETAGQTPDHPDRLVVRAGGRVLLVPVADIRWIEGCGDYARLHTDGRPLLLRRTLQELTTLLDPAQFTRVNRSAIVNLDQVTELRPCSRGEYLLVLGDDEVKLTRTYRQELEARLGQSL